nr:hypothetical protein BaRGS_026865 [Batillaria attramentaria]
MDSWVRVDVPEGHVVMISFRHMDVDNFINDCRNDMVTLYQDTWQWADETIAYFYNIRSGYNSDCSIFRPDTVDEDFCVYPPCAYIGQFQCGDQQCVPQDKRCDGMEHCANGADEKKCFLGRFSTRPVYRVLPPALADSDGRGDGYCLPVFVRCNGVYDCPGKEDEAACDSYTCPGFYRCRDSRVCLHSDHLCDGVFQCPQQDDELLCVFNGLDQLDEVYADNYKLCCPATLPAGFNLPQCRAPTDEISSCDALLRFLCWFPIGLLGVLAANDVVIPGEVSVAMAIIVLPLNSALNPFLYTVNMILERRRQAMERRIEKRVLSKLQAKTTTTTSK